MPLTWVVTAGLTNDAADIRTATTNEHVDIVRIGAHAMILDPDRDPKSTSDGTIVWQPEVHCLGCGQGALGLLRADPQGDLRQRGWSRVRRRWHCGDCAQAAGGRDGT